MRQGLDRRSYGNHRREVSPDNHASSKTKMALRWWPGGAGLRGIKLTTLCAGWGGLGRAARAENQREQGEQTPGERDESEQVVKSRQRMRNLRDYVRGFMSRVGQNRLREQKRGTEAEFPKNFHHTPKARHGA